nr:AraC family transcriptional regulator [Cohnella zeiphila]
MWENTSLAGQEYPFRMFRLQHDNCLKGQQILWLHWHEHFELLLMVKGTAVFHIESEPYEAAPGDLLLVPSGGLHAGFSPCDQDMEFIAFVFNGSMLGGLPHDPVHSRFLAPYIEGKVRFPVRIASGTDAASPVRQCVVRAIEEFNDKRRAYELAVKSHLYLLFSLLAREHLAEREAVGATASFSRNSERFKPLLRYVEEHYQDGITIEEAARRVNLNPYHFCKQFKKLTGRTFVDYVNWYRMNEAERLLLESDLTVTEAADRVGCGNPNYFTKLFKQYKGMTPSQAREQSVR